MSQNQRKAIPPLYFDEVLRESTKLWDKLDGDQVLAAPWRQLFLQVNSPRHVLSELLQNADDAGASEALVKIVDGYFIFEHNGQDFTKDNLSSLCRFGFSNKRTLNTIGFRGIGFKSTFSLGDRVELFTPSLAIAFEKKRFTQPLWIENANISPKITRIKVKIKNNQLLNDIKLNLNEWLKNPVSLLFFRNIRQLQIDEHKLHWQCQQAGPVNNSEWMVLNGDTRKRHLIIRSQEEYFPTEALDEIATEKNLSYEELKHFPPCRVEIVLGAQGRLYVVLPTGIETKLPFACNAPFIQDPARLIIKDIASSPTNTWLLERAGALAANAMQEWLNKTKVTTRERAEAYCLMPDVDRQAITLEGKCAALVEDKFAQNIAELPILLTEEGQLFEAKKVISIAPPIFEIWPIQQAIAFLVDDERQPLCQFVSKESQEKLVHWGMIETFDEDELLERLQHLAPPKPETWHQLLKLWAYIASSVTHWNYRKAKTLRIVPAQGKSVLYPATEIVRLGERRLLQSDKDWDFLSRYLIVLNQNWTLFLAEKRRELIESDQSAAIDAAFAILNEIGLDETSNANVIIEQVAKEYFNNDDIPVEECIQFAQIVAKLGAKAGDSFHFVCNDMVLRPISDDIFYDDSNTLKKLLPNDICDTQLLHDDYVASFTSCSREDWHKWISSGQSGLQIMVPLKPISNGFHGRSKAEEIAKAHGQQQKLSYHFAGQSFNIRDLDFTDNYWQYWQELAIDNPSIWALLVETILKQPKEYIAKALNFQLMQVSQQNSERRVSDERLISNWVLQLRDKPCLRDSDNKIRLPSDLVRRTQETEPVRDIEPFIHVLLDKETAYPLFDLLGVRTKPIGPQNLLSRLRALTGSDKVPPNEVDKWYQRISHMLDTCSTEDAQYIKDAFRKEKLILAQDSSWDTSDNVFLAGAEDDIPDAAIIRASVQDLSLWHKIGVASQPSIDLAMQWLSSLPKDKPLAANDARRAQSLLARYPLRIWHEQGHWLNLLDEWVVIDKLSYNINMQKLVTWSHLHQWVKQEIANFRMLSEDILSAAPFSSLPTLAEAIHDHLEQPIPINDFIDNHDWLRSFGKQLERIKFDNKDENEKVRTIAKAMAITKLLKVENIETIPYLGGIPASIPQDKDILWQDQILFITNISNAKLAKKIPEEIGKNLNSDIRAALAYAFQRSAYDIKTYLEENFTLSEEEIAQEITIGTHKIESPDEDIKSNILLKEGDNGFNMANDSYFEPPMKDNELFIPSPLQGLPHMREGVDNNFVEEDIELKSIAPVKPERADIMERFALDHGYELDTENRYFHADGSFITKTNGARFPWELCAANGNILRYYYPRQHCLENNPLQIDSDMWSLLEKKPDLYSCILLNTQNKPIELTGHYLSKLHEEGKLIIHPASYRLEYRESL